MSQAPDAMNALAYPHFKHGYTQALRDVLVYLEANGDKATLAVLKSQIRSLETEIGDMPSEETERNRIKAVAAALAEPESDKARTVNALERIAAALEFKLPNPDKCSQSENGFHSFRPVVTGISRCKHCQQLRDDRSPWS